MIRKVIWNCLHRIKFRKSPVMLFMRTCEFIFTHSPAVFQSSKNSISTFRCTACKSDQALVYNSQSHQLQPERATDETRRDSASAEWQSLPTSEQRLSNAGDIHRWPISTPGQQASLPVREGDGFLRRSLGLGAFHVSLRSGTLKRGLAAGIFSIKGKPCTNNSSKTSSYACGMIKAATWAEIQKPTARRSQGSAHKMKRNC